MNVLMAGAVGAGCTGSEVGRSDREASRRAAAETVEIPIASSAPSPVLLAYQDLVRQLEPLRLRAFQELDIAARWDEITRFMELRLEARDPSLGPVVDRKYEIEALFAPDSGRSLPAAEREELTREYSAIEARLVEGSNSLLQDPEIAALVDDFQSQLRQRMRELDPSRRVEIDSLEALIERMHAALPAPAQTAVPEASAANDQENRD